MSGYSRIGRGPFGGDQYTNLHNEVFRDKRLSAKAMGVLGHISTHTDGWLTSVEQIAKNMKDGVAAIKGAIQELERYHYVIREQSKLPSGKFGRATIFATDLPAQLRAMGVTDDAQIAATVRKAFADWLEEQNRRSEPLVGNRPTALSSDDGEDDQNLRLVT